MKKSAPKDSDMLDEYDFSGGVRGKHYKEYMKGTNVVLLDPDVAKLFPNSAAVNQALRAIGSIIVEHEKKTPQKRSSARVKAS